MNSRRSFLSQLSGGIALAPLLHNSTSTLFASSPSPTQTAAQPRRLAVITTEWRYHSHAWHMAERFLSGYPLHGSWHRPPFQIVSAYVDQFPTNDLSRQRAQEFGFQIYPTIRDALRHGSSKLNVDAVLIIGEHGNYPKSPLGQTQYPRYEFFKQVAEVFRTDKAVAPVFNDKHLSWNWDWAKEMVEISHQLKIPFLAGSSLPVTWRMPSIDLPYNAPVDEAMCLAMGGVDSYDFHALEVIQCMLERRRGGETGVASVQGLQGEAFWKAFDAGSWAQGGWDRALFEACLARTQTLAQAPTHSHRHPTPSQIREMVKEPVAYRIHYRDGTRATMLLMNGLVGDFTFAARMRNQSQPLSTLFYLPPVPNVTYSASLMSKAEELFTTGKAPYPIERTLLTSGILASSIASLKTTQAPLQTPHLNIAYKSPRNSLFARD